MGACVLPIGYRSANALFNIVPSVTSQTTYLFFFVQQTFLFPQKKKNSLQIIFILFFIHLLLIPLLFNLLKYFIYVFTYSFMFVFIIYIHLHNFNTCIISCAHALARVNFYYHILR